MSEIYWRLHNASTPCFCADHAYSGVWGVTWVSQDGSQHTCTGCLVEPGRADAPCPGCDGYGWDCGRCEGTGHAECDRCDGTGIEDASRGYSCCTSAAELLAYFRQHAGGDMHGDDWTVIAFEGEPWGWGADGEPLVVPTRVVVTLSWGQLMALAEEEEEC